MRTLRYTGPIATEFYDGERSLGEIAPGGEFDVPDEIAERFTRRGDVEDVTVDGPPTGGKNVTTQAPVTPAAS